MAGELNGTDIALAVESAPASGIFNNVGGLVTNSFTLNNGGIDITNKSSASWRELLAGEGLQTAEISAEIIFSNDANFGIMKTSALAKTILNYQIDRNGAIIEGGFMITSWAETAPDNDKLTVSVTLQSSGAITGL